MQTKRNATLHDSSDLLAAIGDRVRSLRARRGMTRKSLTAESAVSERHLAQLELGKGNMSIALLERVARALDTDLADLQRILKEREPFYAKAHHLLDTSSRNIDDCAAELDSITRCDESADRDLQTEAELVTR